MILHTIVSKEDIFKSQNEMKSQFYDFDGGKVEYCNLNGENRIVRLHSTNPYLYLDNSYMPNQIYKINR